MPCVRKVSGENAVKIREVELGHQFSVAKHKYFWQVAANISLKSGAPKLVFGYKKAYQHIWEVKPN